MNEQEKSQLFEEFHKAWEICNEYKGNWYVGNPEVLNRGGREMTDKENSLLNYEGIGICPYCIIIDQWPYQDKYYYAYECLHNKGYVSTTACSDYHQTYCKTLSRIRSLEFKAMQEKNG